METAPMTDSARAAGNRALHTPQEIAQRAIDAKHQIGKSRVLPMKLRAIEELKRQKIHIFNVGPWAQIVNTGSTGTFTIPACPADKPYVEMLVLNAVTQEWEPPISIIMEEYVITSEESMGTLTEDGWEFALQVIGIGRGRHPHTALTRFGMFCTRNSVPTTQELADARKALEAECLRELVWINNVFSTDRKLFSRVMAVAAKKYLTAAKVMGRDNPSDSPWMIDSAPQGRIKCKMCGRVCDPDVATCEAGHVVNMDLYLELQAADEQLKAAIAAKPKGK
jgi:hypothetical protein